MGSRYLTDPTGHFPVRRYYDEGSLEAQAEERITSFLEAYTGGVDFPISTELLTLLIERDAADLDLYAELGSSREEVHGVTQFFRDAKPRVRISATLAQDPGAV